MCIIIIFQEVKYNLSILIQEMTSKMFQNVFMTSKMAQKAKVLATMTDNLNSIPGTHIMRETSSSDLHRCAMAHVPHPHRVLFPDNFLG